MTGSPRVAIVGAGLAGLVAARALTEGGVETVLLEKARGPGGRMATRRRDALAFDHGAQYFTARDERFRRAVASWGEAGVAGAWEAPVVVIGGERVEEVEEKGRSETRYVGVPRMSAITRHLAGGLDVRTSTRVGELSRHGHRWHLATDAGEHLGTYDVVLLALPPAQAAELLRAPAPDLARVADGVAMEPCWAVLAAFDARLDTALDAAFVNEGPLAWVARNASKPARPAPECWVLHASPAWSREHLEEADEDVKTYLLDAFFAALGVEPRTPHYATGHRWRYARAAQPLGEECRYDAARGLGLCGDWCLGARVEGAYLSGLALAERVLADPSLRSPS
jgi:renalase